MMTADELNTRKRTALRKLIVASHVVRDYVNEPRALLARENAAREYREALAAEAAAETPSPVNGAHMPLDPTRH